MYLRTVNLLVCLASLSVPVFGTEVEPLAMLAATAENLRSKATEPNIPVEASMAVPVTKTVGSKRKSEEAELETESPLGKMQALTASTEPITKTAGKKRKSEEAELETEVQARPKPVQIRIQVNEHQAVNALCSLKNAESPSVSGSTTGLNRLANFFPSSTTNPFEIVDPEDKKRTDEELYMEMRNNRRTGGGTGTDFSLSSDCIRYDSISMPRLHRLLKNMSLEKVRKLLQERSIYLKHKDFYKLMRHLYGNNVRTIVDIYGSNAHTTASMLDDLKETIDDKHFFMQFLASFSRYCSDETVACSFAAQCEKLSSAELELIFNYRSILAIPSVNQVKLALGAVKADALEVAKFLARANRDLFAMEDIFTRVRTAKMLKFLLWNLELPMPLTLNFGNEKQYTLYHFLSLEDTQIAKVIKAYAWPTIYGQDVLAKTENDQNSAIWEHLTEIRIDVKATIPYLMDRSVGSLYGTWRIMFAPVPQFRPVVAPPQPSKPKSNRKVRKSSFKEIHQ